MNSDAWLKLDKFSHPLDTDNHDLIPVEDVEYTLLIRVSLKKTLKEGDKITYIMAQTGGCNLIA